jgi:hypothetical protein
MPGHVIAAMFATDKTRRSIEPRRHKRLRRLPR